MSQAAPPTTTEKTARPRRRGLWSWLGLLLLVAVLTPIADVIIHRFAPVPATWLALQRTFEGRDYHRSWRPLERISPNLVQAVIAAEDDRFCSHNGFDWDGIQAALRYNATHKNRVHGGSTISQQTAKNVFLWPGRGWIRKGLEGGYTVLIETLWGKRRIMEVYLNMVEWAPGTYGAEAASQYWFHVSANKLTPAQAAHLAAILPRPLKWKAADSGPVVRRRLARIAPGMGAVRAQSAASCVLG